MLLAIETIIIVLILGNAMCLAEKYAATDPNSVAMDLATNVHQVHNTTIMDKDNVFCQPWYYDVVKCTDQGVLLTFGYCATLDRDNNSFVTKCPYFQLEGHNVSEPGYIGLPQNISELNTYMCGPMNRKGLLCKDCIDGYGPSVTSFGYKCSNCTDAWYGVPLYLMVEFVPITLFYLIILVFKFNLTSAPMTLFILYNQFIMYGILFDKIEPVEKLVAQGDGSPLLSILLLLCGIWNLDFFRYIVPPFCVSSKFQLTHVELLGYISVIYPIFLMFLTWVCVELHGRNFKPLVLLWRPFHRYFVILQRGWDTRSDMIDVFSSFFLLSYGKLIYQVAVFFQCSSLKYIQEGIHYSTNVLLCDLDISCSSQKHLLFVIPLVFVLVMFNILPALLLALYPVKVFRACLSKCRLDRLFLTAFVERFHGCYRDGLDGGRDMRSFSGMYFFLISLASLHQHYFYESLSLSVWLYVAFVFLASILLVALARPYKHMYMNVLDTLLLTHTTVICVLLSRKYFPSEVIQLFVVLLIPTFVFGLLLLFKVCIKVKDRLARYCKNNRKQQANGETAVTVGKSRLDSCEQHPLINPTSTIIDIKVYGSRA